MIPRCTSSGCSAEIMVVAGSLRHFNHQTSTWSENGWFWTNISWCNTSLYIRSNLIFGELEMQMGKVWKYAGSSSASLERILRLSCFLPKANWQMFKLNNHFLACDFPPVFFETVLWHLLTFWVVFSWFSTVLGLPADSSAKKMMLMIITGLWIFVPIYPQRQRHLLTFWAFQVPIPSWW